MVELPLCASLTAPAGGNSRWMIWQSQSVKDLLTTGAKKNIGVAADYGSDGSQSTVAGRAAQPEHAAPAFS